MYKQCGARRFGSVKHITYYYDVFIDNIKREKGIMIDDCLLDYKSEIRALGKEYPGSKIWIKFNHKEYWTEMSQVYFKGI